MQDSILRLLGVMVGSAGIFLFADGQRTLGVIAVVLGVVGILLTAHPAFRLSGERTPHGGSLFPNRAATEARRRGEERLQDAVERGPGARRSNPSP